MTRTYIFLMIGFAVVILGSLAAGLVVPAGLAWGFHFLRFLSPGESGAALALIVAAAFAALHPSGVRFVRRVAAFQQRHPGIFLAIVIAAFIGGAWLLRVRIPLLGDSFYIIKHFAEVDKTETPLDPRNEPIPTFFFYHLMHALGTPGYTELLRSFFIGELLLGCCFIVLAFATVRNIFERPSTQLLGFLFLLSLPYMQFFFGYVENYSWVLVIVALHALVAILVLRGKLPVYALAFLIVLEFLVHYLTLLLLPSSLYLAYRAYRGGRIKELVIGSCIMACATLAVLVGVHWNMTAILMAAPHHHYLPLTSPTEASETASSAYTLFSQYHFLDLLNYFLLLAAPVAAILLLPFAGGRPPLSPFHRQAVVLFLTACVPVAAFVFVAKFDLGAARDWDVCAGYFPLFVLAGLTFALGRANIPAAERVVPVLLLLGLIPSVFMFRVNSSSPASIARYRSLFDTRNSSAESYYSGYRWLAVYYHQAHNDSAPAALWREYLMAHPEDRRGYQNLITNLNWLPGTTGDTLETVYRQWLAALPNDTSAKRDYAALLEYVGDQYFGNGDIYPAEACFRRGTAIDSANPTLLNSLGAVLARQGNVSEAVPFFLGAIRIQRTFSSAYYNLANAYIDLEDYARAFDCLNVAANLGSTEAREMLAASPVPQTLRQYRNVASADEQGKR